MSVTAFRVVNFRSVVDSNWIQLSPDGVTVLVGQNESGKTSILQALYCALSGVSLSPDDKRTTGPDPIIYLRATVDLPALEKPLSEYPAHEANAFKKFVNDRNNIVDLKCQWFAKPGASTLTEFSVTLVEESEFNSDLDTARAAYQKTDVPATEVATANAEEEEEEELPSLTAFDAGDLIHDPLPDGTFFNAESGLLPNTVDIDTKGNPSGPGATAANNFLAIAEIDLPKLLSGDGRYRQNVLNRANQRVSDDFTSFWSQVIGTNSKLTLQCAFEHYSIASGEKSGKPYLEFWISDGNTQLYPKQRSLGVRWFISFYLQLRASEKTSTKRIFLLDEPGANLHAKAQADVLKLIDRLKGDIPVIYSTHSPEMIEYEKLFRVRAVQRDGELEDSPTVVIDGHQLGAASSDTLSPILAAMGSDMSSQTVIKKSGNVLLEEMSGFYYLKAFWMLSNKKQEVHFVAATGVNKLPTLVNMFLGWGLDFLVAVDDDKQGREVFNQLKKEVFGDDDSLARAQLLKFQSFTSIEEVFSKKDFKDLVLNDTTASITGDNSGYLKSAQISKPVTAFRFWLAVQSQKIKRSDLEDESLKAIDSICDSLVSLLEARPS